MTRSVIGADTAAGSRLSAGAITLMKFSAGSSRAARTRSRTTRTRSRASSRPTGAAMRAPAMRLEPSGSSALRMLTGRAKVSSSTSTPCSAW